MLSCPAPAESQPREGIAFGLCILLSRCEGNVLPRQSGSWVTPVAQRTNPPTVRNVFTGGTTFPEKVLADYPLDTGTRGLGHRVCTFFFRPLQQRSSGTVVLSISPAAHLAHPRASRSPSTLLPLRRPSDHAGLRPVHAYTQKLSYLPRPYATLAPLPDT